MVPYRWEHMSFTVRNRMSLYNTYVTYFLMHNSKERAKTVKMVELKVIRAAQDVISRVEASSTSRGW